MATKKTEKVETADLTPKVTRARKPKAPKTRFNGWAEVEVNGEKRYVCPVCGAQLRERQLKQNVYRCYVCGTAAE